MIVLVKGNTKPDLAFTLIRDGEPLNLGGAQGVQLRLRKPSGNTVTRDLVITNETAGTVAGNFGIGDLDESGPCSGEIVVTFADGRTQNGEDKIDFYVRGEFEDVVL